MYLPKACKYCGIAPWESGSVDGGWIRDHLTSCPLSINIQKYRENIIRFDTWNRAINVIESTIEDRERSGRYFFDLGMQDEVEALEALIVKIKTIRDDKSKGNTV